MEEMFSVKSVSGAWPASNGHLGLCSRLPPPFLEGQGLVSGRDSEAPTQKVRCWLGGAAPVTSRLLLISGLPFTGGWRDPREHLREISE